MWVDSVINTIILHFAVRELGGVESGSAYRCFPLQVELLSLGEVSCRFQGMQIFPSVSDGLIPSSLNQLSFFHSQLPDGEKLSQQEVNLYVHWVEALGWFGVFRVV